MSCPEQKCKAGKFPMLPLEEMAWATSSIHCGDGGKTNMITTLRAADVILGRGRAISDWDGNVAFRRIVAEHRREYKLARTGQKKARVGKRVLKRVFDRGGRFVESLAGKMGGKGKTPLFVIVPRSKAITKTCQLLREKKFTAPPPEPPGAGSTSNIQRRKRCARIKIKSVATKESPSSSSFAGVTSALGNNDVQRGKARKHNNKKSPTIGPTYAAKTTIQRRSCYPAKKDAAAWEPVALSLVASSPKAALPVPAPSSSVAAAFPAKRHGVATVASPVAKTEPVLFSGDQGIDMKNEAKELPAFGKMPVANDMAKYDLVANPLEDYEDDNNHVFSTTFDPYTEASMFLRRLDRLLEDSESVAGNEFFDDWTHLVRCATSPAADNDHNDAHGH